MSAADAIPLCVDLDGTLIKTDLLWESMVQLLARKPWLIFVVPLWWLRGRARLKSELARRVELNPSQLPYREDVLEFLRHEHGRGRRMVLATASNYLLAECVAAHLGLFDEVIASDHQTNLRSQQKASRLVQRFGRGGFDYAGNSSADRPVWREARRAIVVGRARCDLPAARVFPTEARIGFHLLRLLRPHQWAKNLIIFVPLLTAHQLNKPSLVWMAALAVVAFSLCASGLYVLNDLLDIESDRCHPGKRQRPFASGALPIPLGFVLVPVLLGAAAAISETLPLRFLLVLGTYLGLTTAYSFWLKRIALLDVFLLAGLYTIRLVAGHEATGVPYSVWLLVFSMFIFLSLALVKRFQELRTYNTHAPGRGYVLEDLELIASLGSSSGYLSVLVLALYVNSEQVRTLYQHPMRLLLICPLFLLWISRIWLQAHRGQLHDDPVLFALRDPISYMTIALTLLILWLAL